MTKTPSEMLAAEWGHKLRLARQSRGFTQAEFGDLVGRDQTSVSRYERGDGPWTPEVMLTFAVALGARVSELFPWPFGIEDMERYRREHSRDRQAVGS